MDLSQAENRVVAYIAPEPSMIDAFESGVDIHSKTASLIFRKPVWLNNSLDDRKSKAA
jgi:DNA polymerase I-like protein with 3'-5' exonuclease and polymerase domains